MTNDNDPDERSMLAKLLRKSADEVEQTEQKADDEDDDEDDAYDEKADPIDSALAEGTIEAADAADLREVAAKMDEGAMQALINNIAEGNLDVNEAVDLVEGVNGGAGDAGGMDKSDGSDDAVDDDVDQKSDADGGDPDGGADADDPDVDQKQAIDEQAIVERIMDVIPDGAGVEASDLMEALQGLEQDADAPDHGELKAALDTAEETQDRLDEVESKLDDLAEDAVTGADVDDAIEQKLNLGDHDDLGGLLEDVVQKADFETVETDSPNAGGTGGDQTLGDTVPTMGGD